MQERRSSRRYSVELKASAIIAATQQTYEGKVTDISFSGLRFVCSDKIEKEHQLEITLAIEKQDVTLQAVVAWSDHLEPLEGVQHGMKVVGVSFVGDSKQLEKFFQKIQQK